MHMLYSHSTCEGLFIKRNFKIKKTLWKLAINSAAAKLRLLHADIYNDEEM